MYNVKKKITNKTKESNQKISSFFGIVNEQSTEVHRDVDQEEKTETIQTEHCNLNISQFSCFDTIFPKILKKVREKNPMAYSDKGKK
jgi:hypothetical protein